ncbi:MAG: glycosyltransferase family 2 protein [Candidatus Limnocylindrales bacterium]
MERVALSVSAIVPVFNEQKIVAAVVTALHASPLIDEIICVDDGSSDGSRAILEALRRSCSWRCPPTGARVEPSRRASAARRAPSSPASTPT